MVSVGYYFEKKWSLLYRERVGVVVRGVPRPPVQFEKPLKYQIIIILGLSTLCRLSRLLLRKEKVFGDHRLQRVGMGVIGPE